MGIDPTYSIVPALRISPRPVVEAAMPYASRQNRQPQTHAREMAVFDYNPGQPRGTYNKVSRMTYPAARAAGRVVNLYV